MAEIIKFVPQDKGAKGVNVGEVIWVNYYPYDGSPDFIKVPLSVIKTYEDGSFDGELERAET